MLRYLLNILLVLDQMLNVLLSGDPDETLSSRAGKRHPKAAAFIDRLFFFDTRHCAKSVEDDEGSFQVPVRDRWQVLLFWVIVVILWLS